MKNEMRAHISLDIARLPKMAGRAEYNAGLHGPQKLTLTGSNPTVTFSLCQNLLSLSDSQSNEQHLTEETIVSLGVESMDNKGRAISALCIIRFPRLS